MVGTVHLDKVRAQEHIPAKASASLKLSSERQLNVSTESAYQRKEQREEASLVTAGCLCASGGHCSLMGD